MKSLPKECVMDQCECLDEVLSRFEGRRDELIPILQGVQTAFGYLPEDAMLRIARFAHVPESAVYAVATFYAQFRSTPIGRNHIMVCRGTACHVRGAPRILEKLQTQLGIEEGETTEDGEFSLETVACIGACGLSPCITINKQVEAKMTPKRVTKLLRAVGGNGDES
jgi:NADH-quinone oxidoreductase subunit E